MRTRAQKQSELRMMAAFWQPAPARSRTRASAAAASSAIAALLAPMTPSRTQKRRLTVQTVQPKSDRPPRLATMRAATDFISPNAKRSLTHKRKRNEEATEPTQEKVVTLGKKPRVIRRTLTYTDEQANESAQDPVKPIVTPAVVHANAPAKLSVERVLEALAGSHVVGRGIVPRVVGRNAERAIIQSAVHRDEKTAGDCKQRSLFVVGSPGTGKSSLVGEILSQYEAQDPSTTVVIRLNCSTFYNPIALYAAIDEQLRSRTSLQLPYLDPCLLDDFLHDTAGKRLKHQIVVMLDEVDQLARMAPAMQSRVKDVLQFLIRWSQTPKSALSFIAILNGVDMYKKITQDVLAPGQCVSELIFPSYSYEDLVLILNSHVQDVVLSCRQASTDSSDSSDFVEPRAVELIARKIAARDGDARRAFSLLQQCARHLLRRAQPADDNHENQPSASQLTVRDVLQCSNAILSSTAVKDVQQLPRVPKILLFVITTLAPGDKTKQCDLNAVSEELARLHAIPAFAWVPVFSRDDLQKHLATLDCYAFVKRAKKTSAVLKASSFWRLKVSSAVIMDVLAKAMQDDPLLHSLVQQ